MKSEKLKVNKEKELKIINRFGVLTIHFSLFTFHFLLVFLRDGVKRGFNLKRSKFRVGFEQKGDDADDMRAGKTVARQIFV